MAELFASARTTLAQKQFDTALALLANIAEIDPADASVGALTKEVRDAQAAAARRAQLVQRITEIEAACSRSDWETAALLVSAAAEAGFADQSLDAFRQRIAASRAKEGRVVSSDATVISARFNIANGEDAVAPNASVEGAVQSTSEALPSAADSSAAASSNVTGRDSTRFHAAVRNARSRAANGRHAAALRLLQELDSSDPAVAEAMADIQGALVRLDDEKRASTASRATLENTGIHQHIDFSHANAAVAADPVTAIFPAVSNQAAVSSPPPIPRALPPPLPSIPRSFPPRVVGESMTADATVIVRVPPAPSKAAATTEKGLWVLVAVGAVAVFLVSLALLLRL